MAWNDLQSNQFISREDAASSPFTKKNGFNPQPSDPTYKRYLNKPEAIYYLDVVAANFNGLTETQWVWKGLFSSATVYSSAAYSESATRNNCGVESNPTAITLTSPLGQFTSSTDQATADALAVSWVQANKQSYANSYGQCVLRAVAWRGIAPYCVQRPVYYSQIVSRVFNKNNCGVNYIGSPVTYTVAANAYSSMVSQIDANKKAQADVDSNGQNYANTNGSCSLATLSIGSLFGGGVVFYILQQGDSGYDANVQHGLIAAPNDLQPTGWDNGWQTWNGGHQLVVGCTDMAIGMGNYNTNLIHTVLTHGGNGSDAGNLCYDLVLNGYSDWYLPSLNELYRLCTARATVGNFTTGYYWSSTENGYLAMTYLFSNGSWQSNTKTDINSVRAIRSF